MRTVKVIKLSTHVTKFNSKSPGVLTEPDCSFSELSATQAQDLVNFLSSTSTRVSQYVLPSVHQYRVALRNGATFDREKRYLTSERSPTGNPIGLRVFGTFPKFKEYDESTTFEVRLLDVAV